MKELSISIVRENFADLVNEVSYGNERIIVQRRNKKLIAMIPVEDLKLLEAIEDKIDIMGANKIISESDGITIPWEEVKKELGL